jgi:hypothetical protein
MSDRNERSSEDNERDVGFSFPDDPGEGADAFREKRLKNRDTADG